MRAMCHLTPGRDGAHPLISNLCVLNHRRCRVSRARAIQNRRHSPEHFRNGNKRHRSLPHTLRRLAFSTCSARKVSRLQACSGLLCSALWVGAAAPQWAPAGWPYHRPAPTRRPSSFCPCITLWCSMCILWGFHPATGAPYEEEFPTEEAAEQAGEQMEEDGELAAGWWVEVPPWCPGTHGHAALLAVAHAEKAILQARDPSMSDTAAGKAAVQSVGALSGKLTSRSAGNKMIADRIAKLLEEVEELGAIARVSSRVGCVVMGVLALASRLTIPHLRAQGALKEEQDEGEEHRLAQQQAMAALGLIDSLLAGAAAQLVLNAGSYGNQPYTGALEDNVRAAVRSGEMKGFLEQAFTTACARADAVVPAGASPQQPAAEAVAAGDEEDEMWRLRKVKMAAGAAAIAQCMAQALDVPEELCQVCLARRWCMLACNACLGLSRLLLPNKKLGSCTLYAERQSLHEPHQRASRRGPPSRQARLRSGVL